MVYLAIDTKTKKGKALVGYLETLDFVKVYKVPNERIIKSMQSARSGKDKEVKDVKKKTK